MDFIIIIILTFFIYILSELIVNAVEFLAHEFKIPEGFTSSVIAALATTIPEFLVPLISFLKGTPDTNEIGVGSIFGGPVLLSTVGFCFMLLVIEAKYRAFRDIYDITNILFFMMSFNILLLANFVTHKKYLVLILVLIYLYFIYNQLKSSKVMEGHQEPLIFAKFLKIKINKKFLAFLQIIFVIISLYFAIHQLVESIEHIAKDLGWTATKTALVFSPFATELPELFNAFIWAKAGKVRLSIGNIVGSLAFQASLPGSLGLLFTDWHLKSMLMVVGLLAIISVIVFALSISRTINLKFGIIAILSILMIYFIYILL